MRAIKFLRWHIVALFSGGKENAPYRVVPIFGTSGYKSIIIHIFLHSYSDLRRHLSNAFLVRVSIAVINHGVKSQAVVAHTF